MQIKYNILFFPDKEKVQSGLTPDEVAYKEDAKLRLRLRWEKHKVDFNVGYRVKLSQWDSETQRCKAKTTNKQRQSASLINGRIQQYEDIVGDIFKSYELKNAIPSPIDIRTLFNSAIGRPGNNADKRERGFFDYFDEFTDEMGSRNNWTASTYQKFASIRKHLDEYNSRINFTDLTDSGLSDYVSYMRGDCDMRNTTIAKQLSFLKWFLRWATAKGYCTTLDYVTFRPKLKTVEKKIVFLEWDELMAIYNHQFDEKEKHLERVRDVFCFCCFTSLRYSDVANLRRTDISDTHINITTVKTADALMIELNDYSRAILSKYADMDFSNGHALPVISNQRMNDYIKEVGQVCGINRPVSITYYKGNNRIDEVYPKYELLGTHTGRRTFICNALSKGIPVQVVMKWTGHSDYKSMKPYIDITDMAKTEAMKLFDK